VTTRIKFGAGTLAFAGVMFLLYPALRPWHDESTVAGARTSMSSDAWVAAHFFGMLGFIAIPLGLFALHTVLASRTSYLALIAAWIGAGLTLPYYGAEDFGLHAIARSATPDLLDVVDQVRFQPVAVTIFGAGLLLIGAAGILAAVAVWRSGVLPAAAGVLFAVGLALFLPQFYLPAAARIAHGAIVLAGCVWLAAALWRSASRSTAPAPLRVPSRV
jgi:uncharacterized membrane protein